MIYHHLRGLNWHPVCPIWPSSLSDSFSGYLLTLFRRCTQIINGDVTNALDLPSIDDDIEVGRRIGLIKCWCRYPYSATPLVALRAAKDSCDMPLWSGNVRVFANVLVYIYIYVFMRARVCEWAGALEFSPAFPATVIYYFIQIY